MEIEVREFLDNYPAPVEDLALAVRALFFHLVPEARERVYTGWRIISFSFGGGNGMASSAPSSPTKAWAGSTCTSPPGSSWPTPVTF